MSVRVVTDTAAALTSELAASWGVRLVPLTVTVDGRSYRDTDLNPAMLAAGRVTTAGPTPGEFMAALQDAPDGAVVITVAASLSSTNAAAHMAASVCDAPVEVVDSRTAAGAQALVVLAAVDQAARDRDVHAVAESARVAARSVRVAGFLENLDGLARSGRVPGLAADAARKTGLQFMFTLRDGSIKPARPATSRASALDRLVELCLASNDPEHAADVMLLGRADGLDERLDNAVAAGRLTIGRRLTGAFGTAITLYTGPGVTGLAWTLRGSDRVLI